MLSVRKSHERGPTDLGWLKSQHTFSFGHYFDQNHMGFESLRVINDDVVAPGAGFGTHPHADMEIISYVLEGSLEHKDSMGNGSIIRPGEVQRLSAGTGITHSEFNHSKTDPVHFLQIWFLPESKGIEPGYEQKTFSDADKTGQFRLVASRDGREDSVSLHQDVDMYVALINLEPIVFKPSASRAQWVHIARGAVTLNDQPLEAGDGVAIREESEIILSEGQDAEVILFDIKTLD